MSIEPKLKELEQEIQELLHIPMAYYCTDDDAVEDYYYFDQDKALQDNMHPLFQCYIPFTGEEYLYFLLVLSQIVKIETLSDTDDVNLFKQDICSMVIRYLKLLKEVDVDKYQILYDKLKRRIQECIC